MKNQPNLNSAPCEQACPTGFFARLKCRLNQVACLAQSFLNPLCETDTHSAITAEQYEVMRSVVRRGYARADGFLGVSELLATTREVPPLGTHELRMWFREYAKCAMAHGVAVSPEEMEVGRGRIALLNRIGLFFAAGTSCPCCLGFRVLFSFIAGFLVAAVVV